MGALFPGRLQVVLSAPAPINGERVTTDIVNHPVYNGLEHKSSRNAAPFRIVRQSQAGCASNLDWTYALVYRSDTDAVLGVQWFLNGELAEGAAGGFTSTVNHST